MKNFFKDVFESFLHYIISTVLTIFSFIADCILVYSFLWIIWDNDWFQMNFISPLDMKLLCLIGVIVLEIGRILYHILEMKDEIMEYRKIKSISNP